ncbi:hypothetical protein HYW67_04345 [Candidatus Parcubacteria bacterium]|nr:hypothetical protein [Candidatus Parcubacteria bacterium]
MKQALAVIIVLAIIVVVAVVVIAVFAGLTGGFPGGGGADGGVFKTSDRASTWVQKVAVAGQGGLGGVDASVLVVSVNQPETLLLGTTGRGLWRSTSSAEVWSPIVSGSILTSRANITALAVDPSTPAIWYVGTWSENLGVLLRTLDNGASFETLYTTSRSAAITGIVVDPSSPTRVYVATAQGGVLVTDNRGATWRALQWFGGQIRRLIMTSDNALWAIPGAGGLWRSRNHGETWEDLTSKLAHLAGSQTIASFTQVPTQPQRLYLGTNRGLVKSEDGGDTWADVKLIVPPQALPITATVVPPGETSTIYAAGGSFVFKSADVGSTWQSVKLPTSRRVIQLTAHPTNPSVLYLGLERPRGGFLPGS